METQESIMTEAPGENKSQPDLFTEENARAEALIAAGDLPGAARLLVDVVELDPENFRCYNNFGIIAWQRKAWSDAFGMFKKAVEIRPDYSDALINLFDAALKLRRVAEIGPLFEKARTLNPRDEEIRIIDESIRREGGAIYTCERGLRIGTFDPLIEEAHALLEAGNLFEAMAKYLKVNDEKGPSAEVFSGLGTISFYQKRYRDAFTLFVEAIKLNPTSKENFLNLLDAARECGMVAEAGRIFAISRENFPHLEEIAGDFQQAAAGA
jgi:tetratricopeptide (TPR) repeat protein